MNKIRAIAAAMIIAAGASSSYAIFGIGAHWGFDFSLSMDNVPSQSVVSVGGTDVLAVSMTDWKPSAINFGGKVYVDIIPVIDAIEVSCNFGLWQYKGRLHYIDPADPTNIGVLDLGLKDVGLKYIGLDNTPYAKLQLDASVRKKIFALPLDLFKLSAGGGLSVHFATPLLSGDVVKDALGGAVNGPDFYTKLDNGDYSKDIVQEIVDRAMGEPVYGMHIVAGASCKFGMIGVYADGKYMIPFSKFDDGENIKGFGFLINAGLMFAL